MRASEAVGRRDRTADPVRPLQLHRVALAVDQGATQAATRVITDLGYYAYATTLGKVLVGILIGVVVLVMARLLGIAMTVDQLRGLATRDTVITAQPLALQLLEFTVIASPVFHRWHHSTAPESANKNFAGLFVVWDLMLGTLHLPHGAAPSVFRISGDPVPESLFRQLTYPFRRNRNARTAQLTA